MTAFVIMGAPVLAQPATAACPTKIFTAYFAEDDDSISREAAVVLDEAAKAYAICNATITISGHTDRKAPDAYNLSLSQRMLANVRSYLAGRGIPEGRMTSQAYGETMPIRPTPDGVAEAANRRVEIAFELNDGW